MIVVSAAWAAPAPVDACAVRTRAAALEAALGDGDVAVRMLDADALQRALDQATAVLPCLEDPLYPDQIARLYRLRGVQAVVGDDPAAAAAWFRGARDLLPAFRVDETLGQPILEAWAAAVPSDATIPLPRADGAWSVDGRPATAAPTDHPWTLQWLGTDGAVRATAILESGASEPPFGVAGPAAPPLPAPASVGTLPPPPPRSHTSRGLAVGALASGLLAGAGIAQAADWRADVLTSDRPSSAQPGLVTANRVVGYGAGGLSVVAVGLGLSAVAVGRW